MKVWLILTLLIFASFAIGYVMGSVHEGERNLRRLIEEYWWSKP